MIGTNEDTFKNKCYAKFPEYDKKINASTDHLFMCKSFDNDIQHALFMKNYVESYYIDDKYYGGNNGK